MILLSGCTVREPRNPGGDVDIEYTGLRPSEKLCEELLLSDTNAPTAHLLIRKALEASLSAERLQQLVAEMVAAVAAWDENEVLCVLRQMVPEYIPQTAQPTLLSGA